MWTHITKYSCDYIQTVDKIINLFLSHFSKTERKMEKQQNSAFFQIHKS